MKRLLFVLFLSSPALAMGRQPSDPATWGDVQNVQSQVTANAQQEQSDYTNAKNQLDDMSKLKVQVGGNLRLYDAKHYSLNLFGLKDVQGTGGDAVGMMVGVKLGKSYEEREIDQLKKEIELLKHPKDSK